MKKLDFRTLLILAMAVVIVFMKVFDKTPKPAAETIKINGKKYEVVDRQIDTEYVEKIKTVTKKGKDIYHDTTIYVPIPTHEPIDTHALLLSYFAKNVFKDTLYLDDSLGIVSVLDTISENKLYHRTWNSNVKKTIITDKLIVKEVKNQIFIGGVMGFDKTNIVNFAGPSLLLKNKKDDIYSIGVGYNNSKQVSVQGGIYWKIKLKK